MEYLILGFVTGLSLILAIGAQNIFVIEQGLKKQHVFLVCIICSVSDFILIFLGIFIFHYFFQYFNSIIELLFNIILFLFLAHFIYEKISIQNKKINFDEKIKGISVTNIITKTLAFTYLNPHVYSDTVFFLGNFSKNFSINEKILFGAGSSIASFFFFFIIGYLSKFFSNYVKNKKIWNFINLLIVLFMSMLAFYVLTVIIISTLKLL